MIFSRIFGYKFHIKPLLMPFIKIMIDKLGSYSGVTEEKREIPVIVSLTSIKERFNDLPKTIYSLIKQNRKPDRIILWLSDEFGNVSNLPYEITQFIKNGVEIRFVNDLGPYTKAIYAFKEFPNAIVATADDDIYYPSDWLDKLYISYAAHPENIHCHRVHRIKLSNGHISPYKSWEKHIKEETARFDNFLTGAGGVLYPPHCFSNEVFRDDIFLKNAPTADDIWFWIMALTNKRKIRLVKDHNKSLISTNIGLQLWGKTLYSFNRKGKNDEQFSNLMKYYSQNILPKLICNNNS